VFEWTEWTKALFDYNTHYYTGVRHLDTMYNLIDKHNIIWHNVNLVIISQLSWRIVVCDKSPVGDLFGGQTWLTLKMSDDVLLYHMHFYHNIYN